ncbi:MAG: winged helix-turn-helix domain-containing protein [Alphaproteobacteria bacterium]|nr:winged helix-turn-helix domain-containing protein [Alphaproteobacteria bacterium]
MNTDTIKILIDDDDPAFSSMIAEYLHDRGHNPVAVEDGDGMRKEMEHGDGDGDGDVDLVLLDLVLPREDGVALTQYIRSNSSVRIIILSGKGDMTDRVLTLELGADDYLQKPFELRELSARINSVSRRLSRDDDKPSEMATSASFADWKLDFIRRRLTSPGGEDVSLTTSEFALLEVFVKNGNRQMSRAELVQAVRGREMKSYDRTIDIHVSRLRKKIEPAKNQPQFIQTVHGGGYMFCEPVTMLSKSA